MATVSGTAHDLVDSRTAALLLGVTPGQVHWLARQGRIVRLQVDQALWFDRTSVDREARLRAETEGRWISFDEAARIAGCSRGTVAAAARRGEIVTRPARSTTGGARGGRASLGVESVRAFAEHRARQKQEVDARRAAARTAHRTAAGPPDDDQVWLAVETAALVLRLSASRIKQLVAADRLPHTRCGARIWLRRQDVEQAAAARAFAHAQRRALRPPGPYSCV